MSEEQLSCVDSPEGAEEAAPAQAAPPVAQGAVSVARVGKRAPEFTAMAYVDGGFRRVSLSDYKGDWVMLCFYPGDFTFV